MELLFLDTGYILALEINTDQHHQEAIIHWKNLLQNKPFLVTTTYVFDEVVTFLNSRNLHQKAVEVGNRLIYAADIQLISVDQALFNEAWQFFIRHSDKSYSMTDCVSFTVMQQLSIQTALTFDKHFIQAGFQKLP